MPKGGSSGLALWYELSRGVAVKRRRRASDVSTRSSTGSRACLSCRFRGCAEAAGKRDTPAHCGDAERKDERGWHCGGTVAVLW